MGYLLAPKSLQRWLFSLVNQISSIVSFILSLLEEILFSGNPDYTTTILYISFYPNKMSIFRYCLNKSVIKTGKECENDEDQVSPHFDVKIYRNKSIRSTSRQKKQNQDPNEMNGSSITSQGPKFNFKLWIAQK